MIIFHNKPTLGKEEQSAAGRIISSGHVAQGEEVEKFEADLCDFFGLPKNHVVAVSSGSAALYLALWSLNGKNKKIGYPVYSCASLRNAVGMLGGENVCLDCADGSPNLDLEQAARSKIDILIAPSMFGIPLNLPKSRNYKVVEDLAQSFGALIKGKRIGLRGELGICSFYATKMITSGGQGGAVISRNKKLIDYIRDYREFDCRKDSNLRFNFQMTDLQAAIGRAQLLKLPNFIRQRQKWFEIYRQSGLNLIDDESKIIEPVRYRIVMKCKNPKKVISALAKADVKAIVPIEEYELLGDPNNFPYARSLAHCTVSLPAYPGLKQADVIKIAQIASEVSLC